MTAPSRRKFKYIGCEIVYREACYLAAVGPNEVDVTFLLKGLHDLETTDMAAKVQEAVDQVDPAMGYEAILLGYARCNDGVVGLTARQLPLVIPRAHDCITFLFGSRQAYRQDHDEHPGTFFKSTGWVERDRAAGGDYSRPAYDKTGVMANLGLTESYEEMVAKYGKDNADFIIESLGGWQKNYSRSLYLKMGVCEEGDFIEAARADAETNGWEFVLRDGDLSLLEKLFLGRWDDDFVVVQPGRTLIARNDEQILDVAP